MTGTFWDPHGEARAALRVIVSDPHYGVPALSNPQIVFNLVKDLLPDSPREANVLIAAAEARLAGLLVDYTRQGMDPATAAHLVTAYFAHRTSLTPDACNWAVSELSIALGLSRYGYAPPAAPAAGVARLDDPPPRSAMAPPPGMGPPPGMAPPAAAQPPTEGMAPPSALPPQLPPPPPPPPAAAPPLPAALPGAPPGFAAPGPPAGAYAAPPPVGAGPRFPVGMLGQESAPGQRRSRNLGWIAAAGAATAVITAVVVFAVILPGSPPLAPTGIAGQAASVPSGVLNSIGSGSAYTDGLLRISGAPLTAQGKPEVLYIGADFCPYCAANQWSMLVALSRFGTFSGVRQSFSAPPPEKYPNTATMTFYRSSYTSHYLTFETVDSETTTQAVLQYPSAQQLAVWRRYDPGKPWPFLDVGNEYKSIKGFYDPGVLRGKDQKQIAAALSNPSSPIAKAVDGAANMVIAAICKTTRQQPGSVCDTPAIQAIQAGL